ncbi:MAG: glycosyltransferase [Phycisphaerae bacterium]|nr:glycosyltransferase [Phycisphaerae bacterium]
MSLRILHVTRTALTVRTFLRPLLAEHQARGHHVELALGRSCAGPSEFGVPVHRYAIDRSVRPDCLVRAVLGLESIFRKGGYDVIVAHMALAGAAARVAFALAGRPGHMVYASHGLPCYRTRGRIGYWAALALERVLGRWNDGMIVLNRYDYRMAAKHRLAGCTGQVHFFHTVGIPYRDILAEAVTLDRGEARRDLGLDPDLPVVVYAGRLIRAKGVQVFLEVAGDLVHKGVRAQFAIAGSGPLDGLVQRFVETHGLAGCVRTLGWREDVVRLLASSDILCLPTFYEGSPVVVQEAMAAGCAVVASDVPGPQDLIDHCATGILVQPGDARGFSGAIADLLADRRRRVDLTRNARLHAAQFDAAMWAPAWASAIESVAEPEAGIRNPESGIEGIQC